MGKKKIYYCVEIDGHIRYFRTHEIAWDYSNNTLGAKPPYRLIYDEEKDQKLIMIAEMAIEEDMQ